MSSQSGSVANWLALALSGVSIVVSIFVAVFSGAFNLGGSTANEMAGVYNASNALCMSWLSYVTEQQANAEAGREDPAQVDERLDRVGTVVLSHALASTDEFARHVFSSTPSITPSTAASLPTAMSSLIPSPTPSQKIAEVNIASRCGSAAELREARETSSPLNLRE